MFQTSDGIGCTENIIIHDINISAKYARSIIVMENKTTVDIGKPEDVISEKLVNGIYDVDCKIVYDDGKPHILSVSIISM